jgi:hypothetical protein
MPLSIMLATAALLLAVPVSFLFLMFAFGAIGPWRTAHPGVRLPDLDDVVDWND